MLDWLSWFIKISCSIRLRKSAEGCVFEVSTFKGATEFASLKCLTSRSEFDTECPLELLAFLLVDPSYHFGKVYIYKNNWIVFHLFFPMLLCLSGIIILFINFIIFILCFKLVTLHFFSFCLLQILFSPKPLSPKFFLFPLGKDNFGLCDRHRTKIPGVVSAQKKYTKHIIGMFSI